MDNLPQYVPTLAIRSSEMNAVENLPALTKDNFTPLFLLAPWSGSPDLDKAIARIEKAYPDRKYFLDIDKAYKTTSSSTKLVSELLLLEEDDEVWMDFISRHENIQPCIQVNERSATQILTQIQHAQQNERIFVLRLETHRLPNNFEEIVDIFCDLGTADFVVVLDAGWVTDALLTYTNMQNIMQTHLSALNPNIPIVVSCTTMPRGFTDIGESKRVPFTNRELVSQVQQSTNRPGGIIYGDWGSTTPRFDSQARLGPARIDYPSDDSWFIVRNESGDRDFQTTARNLMANEEIWDDNLDIWGTELIRQTLSNNSLGVNSAQKNVAARVNIHLHIQSFYGNENRNNLDFDEDWQDT